MNSSKRNASQPEHRDILSTGTKSSKSTSNDICSERSRGKNILTARAVFIEICFQQAVAITHDSFARSLTTAESQLDPEFDSQSESSEASCLCSPGCQTRADQPIRSKGRLQIPAVSESEAASESDAACPPAKTCAVRQFLAARRLKRARCNNFSRPAG